MKNIIANIKNGFLSIARGFSTYYFSIDNNIKIMSDQEAYEEDCRSIASDWVAVGNDIRSVINSMPLNNPKKRRYIKRSWTTKKRRQ